MYELLCKPGAEGEGAAVAQRDAPQPSFREYVSFRKYDYGRGTPDAWSFIAFVRGDKGFPDVASWRELEAYLEEAGAGDAFVRGARSAWRSFTAYRSRARLRGEARMRGTGGGSR